MFERDRRFQIVVRLNDALRGDIAALENLPVPLPHSNLNAPAATVPLRELASFDADRRCQPEYPSVLRCGPPCLMDASAAGPKGNPRRSATAMTISRAEVITSVERRRRWSQGEKERLVAASLEPGTTVSKVARKAGLHVSQLFRWRKVLCKHGETSIARLVPVEIWPSVPPRDVAEAPLTTAPARRRRSQDIIEIDLGSGPRIRVDGDVDDINNRE